MHYSVNVDHNYMATHPTRSVKGFQKCCISSTMDDTHDDLWNGSEEERMTVKMNTVTLIGKDR
jgi:hypothetical protein